jgi:hypothetical protein
MFYQAPLAIPASYLAAKPQAYPGNQEKMLAMADFQLYSQHYSCGESTTDEILSENEVTSDLLYDPHFLYNSGFNCTDGGALGVSGGVINGGSLCDGGSSGNGSCSGNNGKRKTTDDTKFKTELCKNFSETGRCNYGKKCRFAHGKTELQEKNVVDKNRYKSKLCNSFYTNMFCPYGSRCLFIHEQRTLREIKVNYYQKLLNFPELRGNSHFAKSKRLPVFASISGETQENRIPEEYSYSLFSEKRGPEQLFRFTEDTLNCESGQDSYLF